MSSYTRAQADFELKVINKERIIPKKHTTILNQHQPTLSNLDLLLPSEYVGIFLCYKRPNDITTWSFNRIVCTLKESLSQVLWFYEVFAGELVRNCSGEPEIILGDDCGVEFVEAFADIELCFLELYNPDESVEGKLVPVNKRCGLLSVQVTELKCGGLIVACSFDHRVADAHSINMFLISWAELANSNQITIMPCFTSSLLKPRNPPFETSSIDQMYSLISSLEPNKQGALSNEPLVSRIYQINSKQINRIQSLVKSTKLQSFSAFMWKMVSKHASTMISNNNNTNDDTNNDVNEKICKMGIVVDGRTRLSKEEMSCYFGNVLSIPFGARTIRELSEKPLSWIGGEVNNFLKKATNKEHFEDLIDWIEERRPEPALARMYCSGRDDGPAFVVSSGLNLMFSKVEFGWGKPLFGSCHFPWSGNAGYIMPMQNNDTDGWVVYMHLTLGQIDFIEKEASHVFKQFKLC